MPLYINQDVHYNLMIQYWYSIEITDIANNHGPNNYAWNQLQSINISNMHFESKMPNSMSINISHYMVCLIQNEPVR